MARLGATGRAAALFAHGDGVRVVVIDNAGRRPQVETRVSSGARSSTGSRPPAVFFTHAQRIDARPGRCSLRPRSTQRIRTDS